MDKVLLVTGGSRGIGAASCRLAARQGWAVAVNYTANSLAADAVVREIRATGGRAMAVQADVADEAQVMRMFEQVDAKLGRLTGLVNNAGVVDVTARVEDMSVARWKRMFDINVMGSLLCAREAARRHVGMRHFHVQLLGGAAMMGGALAGFVTSFATAAVELSATLMLVQSNADAPLAYGIYVFMQSAAGRGAAPADGLWSRSRPRERAS